MSSKWTISSALSLAGQMSAQLPQPVQSSEDTCILYCNPSSPLPLASIVSNVSGALAASSSFKSIGLITACGQMYEHWLHWIQFSFFQCGRLTAIALFSNLAVPFSKVPSSIPINLDTGRVSPFWAFITSATSSKNLVVSFFSSFSSFKSFQLSGYLISFNSSIPLSTAW